MIELLRTFAAASKDAVFSLQTTLSHLSRLKSSTLQAVANPEPDDEVEVVGLNFDIEGEDADFDFSDGRHEVHDAPASSYANKCAAENGIMLFNIHDSNPAGGKTNPGMVRCVHAGTASWSHLCSLMKHCLIKGLCTFMKKRLLARAMTPCFCSRTACYAMQLRLIG